MAVNYNKLWKLLIDKGMTKTQLRLDADMSTTTLAKMGKNETVSMDIMLRIDGAMWETLWMSLTRLKITIA